MTRCPPAVSVTEAMISRRSIRAFLPDPVDAGTLARIFETAQRAPSGGNVQPWHVAVVSGAPLAALIAKVGERQAMGGRISRMPGSNGRRRAEPVRWQS